MASLFPLVHHARRSLANFRAGNPFVDSAALSRVLAEVRAAYLSPAAGPVASRALHVVADQIEVVLSVAVGG